jgi:hypothetical protein
MWQQVEVVVGLTRHRGRYRVEGRRIVLEWRGGRVFEWCGHVRPDLVAQARLKQLVTRAPVAA